ncbi:MAG: FMN-binding glutamate synthase family protein [Hyphomicrobiaceae bacterium]|nr:FMN-binding glutamate synthase family protein [Hyphomicrobiaceae bacterium]
MRALLLPFTSRFVTFTLVVVATVLLGVLALAVPGWRAVLLLPLLVLAGLSLLGVRDLLQTRHSILRNYPIAGHLRFLFEEIRPEMRQYFFEGEKDGMPFSRDKRAIAYQRAKSELDKRPFGTQFDVYSDAYEWVNHSIAPVPVAHEPFRIAIGGPDCRHPYASSVLNISAMSFGSLSGAAVESLNRGAAIAGCLHNTGEGGVSRHHRHGGELIYQIGTGYFGCRDERGDFSIERLLATIGKAPVRAIEIKLSQGAKPGLGGVLPAAKVTREIADAREVPVGVTVHSPSTHKEFSDVAGLVDFVERIAEATGVPVGIKSAVGQVVFWDQLADHMATTGRGPDFVTVDGGEGGTGAAPLVFTDHVAFPFRDGMSTVFRAFAAHGLHQHIAFFGSGKLGFPQEAVAAMSLGADGVNVAREAMLSIGCIQAQRCHTGHCPTGVATQSRWLARGLVPTDKAARAGNYVMALRHELLRVSRACGVNHPALIDRDAIRLVSEDGALVSVAERYGIPTTIDRLSSEDRSVLEGGR